MLRAANASLSAEARGRAAVDADYRGAVEEVDALRDRVDALEAALAASRAVAARARGRRRASEPGRVEVVEGAGAKVGV